MAKQIFTKTKKRTRVPLSAWIWPILIFILGAPFWLHWTEPSFFLYLNHVFAKMPDWFWAFFTMLCTGTFLIACSSILLLFAPRYFIAVLCALPFIVFFARLGKMLLLSPRPAEVLGVHNIHIIGAPLFYNSMPSGHTTAAFGATSAIYFALDLKSRKRFLWIFIIAILCGLSRIGVGAHWPGDVAVGIVAGLVSGMLGQYILNFINVDWLYQHPIFRVLMMVVMFGLAFWTYHKPLFGNLMMTTQYVIAAITILCTLVFLVKSSLRKR